MKYSGMLWQGDFEAGLAYCRRKYGEPTGIIINNNSIAPVTGLPITINKNIHPNNILFGLSERKDPQDEPQDEPQD